MKVSGTYKPFVEPELATLEDLHTRLKNDDPTALQALREIYHPLCYVGSSSTWFNKIEDLESCLTNLKDKSAGDITRLVKTRLKYSREENEDVTLGEPKSTFYDHRANGTPHKGLKRKGNKHDPLLLNSECNSKGKRDCRAEEKKYSLLADVYESIGDNHDERVLIEMLAAGHSQKEVADALNKSPSTISRMIDTIRTRIGDNHV